MSTIQILSPGETEPTAYPIANDEEWVASLAEQNPGVIYFFAEDGPRDNFGVSIEVGDVVRILSWGAPVRLIDCGRSAEVVGFTRTGNVVLDGAPFGHAVDRIANGRAVRPGHLGVLDRSDRDNRVAAGYEGNR